MRTEIKVIALSAALVAGLSGFARAGDTQTNSVRLASLSNSVHAAIFASRGEVNSPSKAVRIDPRLSPKVVAVQRKLSAPVTTVRSLPSCDNISCGSYSQIGINF